MFTGWERIEDLSDKQLLEGERKLSRFLVIEEGNRKKYVRSVNLTCKTWSVTTLRRMHKEIDNRPWLKERENRHGSL